MHSGRLPDREPLLQSMARVVVSVGCPDSIYPDIVTDGAHNLIRNFGQIIRKRWYVEVVGGRAWNIISWGPCPPKRAGREDCSTIDEEVLHLLLMGPKAGVKRLLTLHLLGTLVEGDLRTVAELQPETSNLIWCDR